MTRAPIECACTNLKMSARLVARAYDDALAPLGINVTQYAVLANVARHSPITLMDLANHLVLERTTLYRAIDRLKKRGLVQLSAVGDGPALNVAPTEKGTSLLADAKPAWERVQARFVAGLGAERWLDFLGLLGEVREIATPGT